MGDAALPALPLPYLCPTCYFSQVVEKVAIALPALPFRRFIKSSMCGVNETLPIYEKQVGQVGQVGKRQVNQKVKMPYLIA